ncbi:hypothetical protein NS228_05215 [Methylobacterium indicum]|uniref:hypothetical protein n=1 Tax=Methylobacterium indicum TaxID=1775910 RepID=UPI0007343744|nr:hypothetical protein [Methylobacterium indicum]KTS34233.1 hypothetical protein NS229_11510 [Methylobacterium indicum]KTS41782.1 hypothetical protein NS228_05215 [Methylobacterium indicum]KTS53121.1 hypothetical protein NS230_07760 [Methylobacterium indicum]
MSDWHQIVFNIAHMSYAQGGKGSWEWLRAREKADVLWAWWRDADGTTHARVVRGRDLDQPDLLHSAEIVEDEDQAFYLAESAGDEMALDEDGKTLLLPEPAVPEHHVAMLLSGRLKATNGLRPVEGGTKWV